MALVASVHAKTIALIKLSIEMTTAAGSGHPTSAASLAHLVTLLMYNHMRYDPAYPNHPAADRLVLSEGHACPIVYAAAVQQALEVHAAHAYAAAATPCAIVARTVKGWGFTSVLGSNVHGRVATEAEQAQALAALDATAQRLGATWSAGDLHIPPLPSMPAPGLQPVQPVPSFREALQRYGQQEMLAKGKMAPRRAYGVALQALGHANPCVVALDGDGRNSTYSENFLHDAALQERFFECRIAEKNRFGF